MSKEIEICTIDGTKWIMGEEAPREMNWQDAKDWCKSVGQQLPPREVLLMAYMNPEIRRGFVNYFYWSSSETNSNYAWSQDFSDGRQNYSGKDYTRPVRAVRAIKGLTPRQGLEEFKKGYAKAELDLKREPLNNHVTTVMFHDSKRATHSDSYWEGISDAEQAHGITGGEE